MNDTNEQTSNTYKPSRYNHFFPYGENEILAYNAFSNSFARVNTEKYTIINKILASPNLEPDNDNSSNSTADPGDWDTLKGDLIGNGFLIDSRFDEFEVLKAQNQIGRFANRSLALTIAPTLECNLKCDYCFEDKKKDVMTAEVETSLIHFVDKKLETLKVLNLSWFGGEPLLKLDTIENLMGSFNQLCKKHGAAIPPASIITNGYLLTKKTAERLRAANILNVQVTLDGPPEIHDKRRKLKNGKGTFDAILDNLKNALEILRLTVRINVDKQNEDAFSDFMKLWQREGFSKKVPFYFGRVVSNTKSCADIASSCLNSKEFSETIVRKYKEAKELGLTNILYPNLRKSGYCLADNLNGFVIAPSGLLFKCWEEISCGVERSVGHLSQRSPAPPQVMNRVKYLNWNPFLVDNCKDCSILPICVGSCPYNSFFYSNQPECSSWKHNLYDLLKLKYETFVAKKNKGGK